MNGIRRKIGQFVSIYPNICGFGALSNAGVPYLAEGRPLVDILPQLIIHNLKKINDTNIFFPLYTGT